MMYRATAKTSSLRRALTAAYSSGRESGPTILNRRQARPMLQQVVERHSLSHHHQSCCLLLSGRHHRRRLFYTTLADPAPGSPFHYAFPVHDLELAKEFYGNILGCAEGRASVNKWQDYSLHGHQIVCHWVGEEYRCRDYYNPVDGDEVPVPHAGLALTVEQFHQLADRVERAGVEFIVKPHLRFQGMPGEQWTMFFKDPSGNNLEFKAMTKMENLFAKYNVDEK